MSALRRLRGTHKSVKYVLSSRGKQQLCVHGYMYYENRSAGNTKYWECVQGRTLHCPSKVVTIGEEIVGNKIDHSHAPCSEAMHVAEARNYLRTKAACSSDKPSNIISAQRDSMGATAVAESIDSPHRYLLEVGGFIVVCAAGNLKSLLLECCQI